MPISEIESELTLAIRQSFVPNTIQTVASKCNGTASESDALESHIASSAQMVKPLVYEEYSKDRNFKLSMGETTNTNNNNNKEMKTMLMNGGQHHQNAINGQTLEANTANSQNNNNKSAPGKMITELPQPKRVFYPRQKVQTGWKGSDWKWEIGAGMMNMGNTCYLNSTLQALFHVPAMANWLASDSDHRDKCEEQNGQNSCIICAMSKTLLSAQTSQYPIKPWPVYSKLKLVCKHLVHGRQEDAHEFLRYLIEAMEKAYLAPYKLPATFDQYSKETTPLNQILGGYLRSSVRCLSCQHLSVTFQHFEDLLLDIRKASTVDEALQGYFARERLEDMGYKCEGCKKKVSATKQFSLERPPAVLCIQLKRFSMQGTKLNKQVIIKPKLDLSPYVVRKDGGNLTYRLVSMVTHLGSSQHCGHYTAIGLTESGTYYHFDDSSVRPISLQNVLQTNAYIIFYELEANSVADQQRCNGTTTILTNGNTNTAAASNPIAVSNSATTITTVKTNGLTFNRTSLANKENHQRPPILVNGNSEGCKTTGQKEGFIGPVLPPPHFSNKDSTNTKAERNGVPVTTTNGHTNSSTSAAANKAIKVALIKQKYGITNVNIDQLKRYPSPDFKSTGATAAALAALPSMPRLSDPALDESVDEGDDDNDKRPTKKVVTPNNKSLVPYGFEYTSDEDEETTVTPSKPILPVENGTAVSNGTATPFVKTNSGIWKVYETDDEDLPTKSNNHNGRSEAPTQQQEHSSASSAKNKTNGFMGGPSSSKTLTNGIMNGHGKGGNNKHVLNELLKSDHRGYGGVAVTTWSGQKSNMDKEVEEDKRQELKKRERQNQCDDDEDMDRGKAKKAKFNGNVGRDNPGFNPFQDYQNRQQQQQPHAWVHNNRGGGGTTFRQKFYKNYNGNGHHHKRPPHAQHNRYNNRNYNGAGFRGNGGNRNRHHFHNNKNNNNSNSNGYGRHKL